MSTLELLALSQLLHKEGLHFKRLFLKNGRYHAHIRRGEFVTCVGVHEDPAEAIQRALNDLLASEPAGVAAHS